MDTVLFQAPPPEDDNPESLPRHEVPDEESAADDERPGDQNDNLNPGSAESQTITVNGQAVDVGNLTSDVAQFPHYKPRSRKSFVTQMTRNPLPGAPPADALFAISRGLADPVKARKALLHELTVSDRTDAGTVIRLPQADVFLNEIVVLSQPRSAGEGSMTVTPPVIEGVLDDDDAVTACLTMRFDSHTHVLEWSEACISQTLRLGNDYSASIAIRGINRPILVHPVQLVFADGSPEMSVLVARDGNSRIIGAYKAQLGDGASDSDVHKRMRDQLRKITAAEAEGRPVGSAWAEDRAQTVRRWCDSIGQGFARDSRSKDTAIPENAIRLAQTLTVPVDMYVGFVEHPTATFAKKFTFDAAMTQLVEQIHVDSHGWLPSARDQQTIAACLRWLAHDRSTHGDPLALATRQVAAAFPYVQVKALRMGIHEIKNTRQTGRLQHTFVGSQGRAEHNVFPDAAVEQ